MCLPLYFAELCREVKAHRAWQWLLAILSTGLIVSGQAVVINEIMYHPPGDQDTLQYIELHNPGSAEVDLTGWKLAGGVKFTFPAPTKIAAGGFLVVSRDPVAFQRAYNNPAAIAGAFTGKLSHKGEKLELVNANGTVVEKLHYSDQRPWPTGPDGYGSSLERICPQAAANDPRNWSSSPAAAALRPAGSPGEANTLTSKKALPTVDNVRWPKLLQPNTPLDITADVRADGGVQKVVLQYQTIRASRTAPAIATSELPMKPAAAASGASSFSTQIPGQPAGTLIRFTIQITDQSSQTRVEPSATEPRPAFSACVLEKFERGAVPNITVINHEPLRGGGNKMAPPRKDKKGGGRSAVVYVPPQGEPQLFDFVQVRRRSGGLKIHAFGDEPIDAMTSFNLVFEGSPRWMLSEHLSYELYRKAGMNIQKSGHARLTVDGRPLGYYLLVEQPNKHFLARSGRDDDGNLYKVLWFGRSIVDQHEKKTHPETGHKDITSLIEGLRSKRGAEQWAFINEQLNVDAFVNYYAVNMCIQNWDGFFNNHFFYHDVKPGGKWDVIPWDEDKTWGDFDGTSQDYSWYDMPLTFGSNLDRSNGGAGGGGGWFGGGGGPFGGTQWWRPPGMISGPLLANPQFRQKFEARLRELCQTVFTDEKFGPIVDQLAVRLRPEVELKARAMGMDPGVALKEFNGNIASFHRQLINRRKFILSALPK